MDFQKPEPHANEVERLKDPILTTNTVGFKSIAYSRNSAEIYLKCPIIAYEDPQKCKRVFKSTAQLNFHLVTDHNTKNKTETVQVERVKKALEGISLGLEIGVLQA